MELQLNNKFNNSGATGTIDLEDEIIYNICNGIYCNNTIRSLPPFIKVKMVDDYGSERCFQNKTSGYLDISHTAYTTLKNYISLPPDTLSSCSDLQDTRYTYGLTQYITIELIPTDQIKIKNILPVAKDLSTITDIDYIYCSHSPSFGTQYNLINQSNNQELIINNATETVYIVIKLTNQQEIAGVRFIHNAAIDATNLNGNIYLLTTDPDDSQKITGKIKISIPRTSSADYTVRTQNIQKEVNSFDRYSSFHLTSTINPKPVNLVTSSDNNLFKDFKYYIDDQNICLKPISSIIKLNDLDDALTNQNINWMNQRFFSCNSDPQIDTRFKPISGRSLRIETKNTGETINLKKFAVYSDSNTLNRLIPSDFYINVVAAGFSIDSWKTKFIDTVYESQNETIFSTGSNPTIKTYIDFNFGYDNSKVFNFIKIDFEESETIAKTKYVIYIFDTNGKVLFDSSVQ